MADHQTYRKDFPVSWDEMHRNSKALAWRLLGKGPLPGGKWKGVLAITRGGLVPACIMARELEVLLVETFCISTYDVKDMGKSNILKMPAAVEGQGIGGGESACAVGRAVRRAQRRPARGARPRDRRRRSIR